MANGRRPGPTCSYNQPQQVEDGTSCRTETPPPGSLPFCTHKGTPDFSWGYWDVVIWKVLPKWMGGDPDLLRNYKDAWVRGHRSQIKGLSAAYTLPPELLGGVAWIEVGGKPYSSKIQLYNLRRFDHSGDPLLEPLSLTKKPEMTSMGPVAIQLRRAAEAMGIDYKDLSESDRSELVDCLQNGDNELSIVAKHLWQLKQVDFRDKATLGKFEIRIIATRFNRGPELPLEKIKQDTSYGDFIINRIYDRVLQLLKE